MKGGEIPPDTYVPYIAKRKASGVTILGYVSLNYILDLITVGADIISDFETGTDKIVLDSSTFTSISSAFGTGFSMAGEFATVTTDAEAATSTADIVYNSVNGNLFYNPNNSDCGFDTGGLLATLVGTPTLTAMDFVITWFMAIY